MSNWYYLGSTSPLSKKQLANTKHSREPQMEQKILKFHSYGAS